MSAFIRTVDGEYVALAHVRRAVQCHTKEPRLQLLDNEERSLGVVDPDDWDRAIGDVVPDARGSVAVMFSVCSQGRPTEADLQVERVPILAWRIDGNDATPIFAEVPPSDAFWMIEYPDGKLCSPNDSIYASLDDAKADELARAQAEWDRKHEAKQAAD